jgi:hypothetical protein
MDGQREKRFQFAGRRILKIYFSLVGEKLNGKIGAVMEPYSSSSEDEDANDNILWYGNIIPLPMVLASRCSLSHPSTLEDSDKY